MSSLIAGALLASILPTAAAAEDRPARSVHLVIGGYRTHDDAFDLFSPNTSLPAMGLRLEQDLAGPFSIVGSYTRRRVASEYYDGMVEADRTPPEDEEAALVAAFTGQQITVGPKVRVDWGGLFTPYAVAQGMAFIGTARLDDAPSTEDNLNELRMRGWAPGFVAAGGVEFTPEVGPLQFSSYLEMGYNWTAQLDLNDPAIRENGTNEPASMGDIAFRGYYLQVGAGVRF